MSNSKRNNCVDPVFLLEKYAGDCKDEWKIWHRDTEKAIERIYVIIDTYICEVIYKLMRPHRSIATHYKRWDS